MTDTDERSGQEPHSSYGHSKRGAAVTQHLTGMYKTWFIDYASYVILERAVPHLLDGLKPVQRRILHAMKRIDDGRLNKVANIVGYTMQYHPHGDASIGDALVQLGQKELLVDHQGNWGNIYTGDQAAAPRYIEARLSKFANETLFNPKTTQWKLSYDGRNKEPITLPAKFPLLLAQGAEGIAVGLSSKILPHNFNEICDAAIHCLRGEPFELFPDFQTGGMVDVSKYNDGARGGSVKIRARINKLDNKTLVIKDIPFGKTTSTLIDSIIKAADKGKIKIKKVDDNTAKDVEILINLVPGVSPDKTIDALYAFTDCEISVSMNCCVIYDNKPHFTSVSDILRQTTANTLKLLEKELLIEKAELEEDLLFATLERIFIEERIYKDKEYEESKSKDEACTHITKRIEPFKAMFIREVTRDDLDKLFDIRMVRILKFSSDQANENIANLKSKIKDIEQKLANMTGYTCEWFRILKEKYGKDFPRRTEIRSFDTIEAAKVAEANEKLYINREEGFIGTSLKKDEFISNCSNLDDVIIFYKDGKYTVTPVSEKKFVGKNIIHIDIFKKNDNRTIYNAIYKNGKDGIYYIKRFFVTAITRDKMYDLTQGEKGSKVVYFTANSNGEAELVKVMLRPNPKLRKVVFDKDFSEIAIKGRQSMGNILTKNDIQKITLKQKGESTLGGRKVWFDSDVLKLNYDGRGEFIGEFNSQDKILVVTTNGNYYTTSFDLSVHFDDNIHIIEKYDSGKTWTALLHDASQNDFLYMKRFRFEPSNKQQSYIGEDSGSRIVALTCNPSPVFEITFGGADEFRQKLTVAAEEFVAVKGVKAKGKRVTTFNVSSVEELKQMDDGNTTTANIEDAEENSSYSNDNDNDNDNDINLGFDDPATE